MGRTTRRAPTLSALAALACTAACNLLVGGDELVFRDGGGAAGAGNAGGSGAGGSGGSGATMETGGSGGDGGGGAAPTGPVLAVAAGGFTCAILASKTVRCWGANDFGQLGIMGTNAVGDTAPPTVDVTLGDLVVEQVVVGSAHACARTDGGDVYCWGLGADGRLGLGDGLNANIGDNEEVFTAGAVPIGGNVTGLAAGDAHTCALLDTGRVRCWGLGADGRLGYGQLNNVGTNDSPALKGDLELGGQTVEHISAGGAHTCASFAGGDVTCWGLGIDGQLGYGDPASIGSIPWSPAVVATGGGDAIDVAAGGAHTCVLVVDEEPRCWGRAPANGYEVAYGASDLPSDAPSIALGFAPSQISAGTDHTCVVWSTGKVRCWGVGDDGRLGYGNELDQIASRTTDVAVADQQTVTQIATGSRHTCARLSNGAVRCWGYGGDGRLGYGNTNNVGDVMSPADAGDVPL